MDIGKMLGLKRLERDVRNSIKSLGIDEKNLLVILAAEGKDAAVEAICDKQRSQAVEIVDYLLEKAARSLKVD